MIIQTQMNKPSLYGSFRGQTFVQSYPDVEEFVADMREIPFDIPQEVQDEAEQIYYLLYARYGNSTIASSDLNQFKYQLFATIFQYAPTWQKRLEIQRQLRALEDNDIFTGSKQIANHAYHPATLPGTSTSEELQYIDQQNTMTWKKSKLEGYNQLMYLLDTDVTEEFINKFKKLFIYIVEPNNYLFYTEDNN